MSPSGTITRVAGTGVGGISGDDGRATDAQLGAPTGVAVTGDGGFLVVAAYVVRNVSASGTISRVAGNGTGGNTGDDGPATDAQLTDAFRVAITADGGFLILDSGARVVRKVSAAGTITRVAGNGTAGNTGDDGPATDAQLSSPYGIAVTADGGFLIADAEARVVRKVSAAGTITRVAGNGTAGNTGDDGPATDAQLSYPYNVAVTADGGFLIADWGGHVVRKVSPSGTISRLAGNGTAGNTGDDGPATDAQLNSPSGVTATADGGFLVVDYVSHVVRKVSASGTISRVAGNGTAGSTGDDGPATDAQLNGPAEAAVTADGGFLIVDYDGHVVRKVSP